MPLTLAESSKPINSELVELLVSKGAKRTWRRPPKAAPPAPAPKVRPDGFIFEEHTFEKDGKKFTTFEFDTGC